MKKLIKRIVQLLLRTNKSDVNGTDLLIKRGILKVGDNSDISGLNIYSHLFSDNNVNVIIGNNCQILGQIELQSNQARVIIGNDVYIGPNTKLFCRERIDIGNDVLISWGCTLIDTNFHSLNFEDRKDDVRDGKKDWTHLKWKGVIDKPLIIKDKAWIGFNTIINKGVTIEEGTIVGAGSVVSKSTGSYTVVGGNPAKFIKEL